MMGSVEKNEFQCQGVIARPPDIEIQFFQLILPILSYYWLNDLNIEI